MVRVIGEKLHQPSRLLDERQLNCRLPRSYQIVRRNLINETPNASSFITLYVFQRQSGSMGNMKSARRFAPLSDSHAWLREKHGPRVGNGFSKHRGDLRPRKAVINYAAVTTVTLISKGISACIAVEGPVKLLKLTRADGLAMEDAWNSRDTLFSTEHPDRQRHNIGFLELANWTELNHLSLKYFCNEIFFVAVVRKTWSY